MAFWKASDAPALGVMSRAGLGICALAAAIAGAAPLIGDLLEGPDRAGRGTRTATFDDGLRHRRRSSAPSCSSAPR